MMKLLLSILIALAAYCIGSISTARIYSKWFRKSKIAKSGEGKQGTRGAKQKSRSRSGFALAVIEVIKGLIAVWLARMFLLSPGWQIVCAGMVILGNDFPVFARFKGGEGLAVTAGVLLGFFPVETMLGLIVFALLYLFFHNLNLAAGFGLGAVILQLFLNHASAALIIFSILAVLFIPLKKRFKPLVTVKLHHTK